MLRPTPIAAVLAAVFAVVAAPATTAAEMQLDISIPRLDVAEYHRPYVASWIEREDNSVAGQLLVWYQLDKPTARNNEKTAPAEDGRKWLPDLRQWWRRVGRQIEAPADGVAGATRPAALHSLSFDSSHPALVDLPAGSYRLVVEAAREVGGRELLKIPFHWPPASASEASAEGRSELGRIALKLSP